ncbi:MAG: hydantoinase/oxoprolinase family protein [Anaerolineae bacterium]|jgi:N-methylhydantoinase A
MGMLLGVDIGGTFTDFVTIDETGDVRIHKRLTTPKDPSQALLAGVHELQLPSGHATDVVHGSTIATNALLERKGARTALVTTRGFADVLQIGRQTRPALYALHPRRPSPLIPSQWRYEVTERVARDGSVITPLSLDELDPIVERLLADNIESVAVCLLFSFLHPAHEQAVRDRICATARARGAAPFVSLSSEVLPEFREYERTSATTINAYVAPLMNRYLSRLEEGLEGRRLRIMQSNGGVISAATAASQAARTVLSGPAGGVVGAYHVARLSGFDHTITFDMGGTSTDVALCDGGIPTTSEGEIGGMPLRLPMLDIHTVGAGGGSLAQVDIGGALTVGPQSAGADPGPVCYGRGGKIPTTTDCNLILGRLDSDHFLGGAMSLDLPSAQAALRKLAGEMSSGSVAAAAWGAIRVANATMERAIRRISVERGHDPRRFALLAFGGAGPLHACELAAALNIPTVLVPRTPGVLSALGMLVADLVKDYSQTIMLRVEPAHNSTDQDIPGILKERFRPLEERGREDLLAEGVASPHMTFDQALDMRYAGQSHELTVPVFDGKDPIEAFHNAHQRRFGHRHPDEPVEIVNVRVVAKGALTKPRFPAEAAGAPEASAARIGQKAVFFGPSTAVETHLYARERLKAGNEIDGPAIIFQLDTTTVVPPGWRARVDAYGTLVITS